MLRAIKGVSCNDDRFDMLCSEHIFLSISTLNWLGSVLAPFFLNGSPYVRPAVIRR